MLVMRQRKKSSKKEEMIFHFSHSLGILMMKMLDLELTMLGKLEVELMMMKTKNLRDS